MKTVLLRYCAIMLCCGCVFLQSCVSFTPISTYTGHLQQNENQIQIVDPQYKAERLFLNTPLGRTTLVFGSFLLGGGATYFALPPAAPQGQDAKLYVSVLGGLLTGVLTWWVQSWFPVPGNVSEWDHKPRIGQENQWLAGFDNNLKIAKRIYNEEKRQVDRLYVIPASMESVYTIRNVDDIDYFLEAFGTGIFGIKGHPQLVPKVIEGLPRVNSYTEVDKIGERFSGLFNGNAAVHDKIREVYFSREKTVRGCERLVESRFPDATEQAAKRAFEIVNSANTLEQYEEFLSVFPNSSLAPTVIKAFTARKYVIYKEKFQNSRSIGDFESFIANYSNNDYDKLIPKAKERIKQLKYQEYKGVVV